MRHDVTTFVRVKELISLGLSDYAVASATGVSRGTVQRWRRRADPPVARAAADDWRVVSGRRYCYLLGCYLGDGTILHKPPHGWTLRITCDRQYPAIIEEVLDAMVDVFPGGRALRFASSTSASDVLQVSHVGIAKAFPQHGPGRKHLREIKLAEWQRELTHAHPDALIRGLIHSDGCRVENRFKTKLPSGRVAEYQYARYVFSNLSADIRNIFAEHCELLGVRVTQSNHRNLSVAHRKSVAILDTYVGPKT
jgi:hypothetical protein